MKTVEFVHPETGEIDTYVEPRVRTKFNYFADKVSLKTGLACVKPSKTQQSFKEDADINTIVRRFGLTGKLPDNVRMPEYADYNDVFDFQTAMNTMMEAEREFMKLPSDIRRRFENDPQQLLEFVSNDANYDEAVKIGLVKAKAPPPPPPEPAPPAPGPAST